MPSSQCELQTCKVIVASCESAALTHTVKPLRSNASLLSALVNETVPFFRGREDDKDACAPVMYCCPPGKAVGCIVSS